MRRKKAIINIMTSLFFQLVTIIYGFIIPRVIISNYGSSVNGLISSITQFLGYIVLIDGGFGPVLKSILYKPIANNDIDTIKRILKSSENIFRKISYIFVMYIVLLSLTYPFFVSKSFGFVYTFSLIIIMAISSFCEYFFGITYGLLIQAKQDYHFISIVQSIISILTIIVIIICVKIGLEIHIVKLVTCLLFIIRPFMQRIYVKKKYKIDLKDTSSDYIINNKWDGLSQHIASVIHDNTDVAILTIFTDLIEVSVYSVYLIVIKGIKNIIRSFSNGIDSIFGDMIAKNEISNLREKFDMYEILFFGIITFIFSCTFLLITPFVRVYTSGINDANYIRYIFGYLIVLSEYLWAIRVPYMTLIHAGGFFKQTRIGAWVECVSNLAVSLLLVKKFGVIGVAIGTITAMLIRTIEFVIFANKIILKRSLNDSIKKIFLLIIETIIIIIICHFIPYLEPISYFNWIINSLITSCVALCVIILFYIVVYYKTISNIYSFYKQIKKRT